MASSFMFHPIVDSLIITDADWLVPCYSLGLHRVLVLSLCSLVITFLSWSAKRQVTLSHLVLRQIIGACGMLLAETAWISELLLELHTPLFIATLVYCDNVHVLHVPSRFQYTNIFTKGLPTALFLDLNRSMDSDKYLEGQSMQRPPLFESDHFIYWKNRFETYVKAKDLDLWHIILNGDFPPVAKNEVTQILEVVPFEEQSDDLKKKLAKNNEAKMVLYNALPKKEYERIFMCKMAKDIWQSLLITHQGNSQVKDNKIDLLVQQYEQFTILEEESIDSGFARFNTIITSLKALDEVSLG
ncbi:hypothetical protein Tco_0798382 [Tanacetum coccineum]